MARARNIKPAFFTNDDLAECYVEARLLFISLWCLADREGRLPNRPKKIKVQTFPYDENIDIDRLLSQLIKYKFIFTYVADGQSIIQVNNWAKHQNPHHREVKSDLPKYDESIHGSCTDHGRIMHDSCTDHGRVIDDPSIAKDGFIHESSNFEERIYKKNGRICNYCKAVDNLEIDHIIPISNNGNGADDNLQVLCKNCSALKHNNKVNHELSMKHGRVMHESCMDHGRVKQVASVPLIPDSGFLIPDSLNLIPDSLIPDSCASGLNPPSAKNLTGVAVKKPDGNPPTQKSDDGIKKPRSPPSTLPAKNQEIPLTRETWKAYSDIYFLRYGAEPVRNASVSGKLMQFIKRIGVAESPQVAAFFVNHNSQYYVQRMHDVGTLLKDAEKLRTEWATNRTVTTTQARQVDKTQTNANIFNQLIAEQRGARNA